MKKVPLVKLKRPDGNVEYSFVHPELIEYFAVRKNREMGILQASKNFSPSIKMV